MYIIYTYYIYKIYNTRTHIYIHTYTHTYIYIYIYEQGYQSNLAIFSIQLNGAEAQAPWNVGFLAVAPVFPFSTIKCGKPQV